MSDPIKLLIADREPTRQGIRLALEGVVEICAEADGVEQAIRSAKREQPDMCLVDASLGGDGIGAVRGICRAAPYAAVVVLAHETDPEVLLESVRAGAIGFVPPPLDAERLRRVVEAVAADEAVVPRSMVLGLLLELRGSGEGSDALTSREAQVLGMLRRANTTREIARRLGIAPVTVRRHISALVRKLGVADRDGLVEDEALWWTNGRRSASPEDDADGSPPVRPQASPRRTA